MRRFSRRFLAVAAVLALAMAACGGDGDDNGGGGGTGADGGNGDGGDGGNGDGGNGEAKDLPPCPIGAIEEAGGPVNITFWHAMTRENEETLKRLTETFNSSQQDVTVELVNQTSYTDNLTKYKAGLGGGDLPDLIQIEDTGLQLMVDSQGILPAQSCIDAEEYDLSDHVERVVQYYSIDDVLYPMPFNVSNPILYYNRSAFEKAGLDPDDPPATLEEVRDASQKIVDAGAADFGFAIKTDAWYVEQWLAKGGSPYVNNGNGRQGRASETAFDSDAGREIFNWLSSMVDDKLALNTGEADIDHLLAIGNENAAMTVDTSAALGTIVVVLESGEFPDVELGVGPMPGPSGEGGVLVGGGSLYIVNKSAPEKQEAAWRFAKFLNEPENMAEWSAGTGYVPIRMSATEQQVLVDRWASEPGFRVAYDQLLEGVENEATAGPVLGAYQDVRDAVIDALQSMFTEGKPAEQALTEAAQRGTEAIQSYNDRLGV